MNVVNNSLKNGLAAAALLIICSAQVSLAGYVNKTYPTNTPAGPKLAGSVSANLAYSLLGSATAVTANNVLFNPTAGVNVSGTTWTNKATLANAPTSPSVASAQSYVSTALPGGPKVVTYGNSPSTVAAGTGGTDADPELAAKLAAEGYQVVPNPCGAGYFIASGEEVINGQNYLVVLGTATDGTVHWFRGYVWNLLREPTDKDDVVANGQKLYDVLVPGPFDFGDMTSTDRCKALKIPINYNGPNLYLISQGSSSSGAPLSLVNCPDPNTPWNLSSCSSVLMYPTITTSGGCGAVSPVTFNPPASALPPGLSTVTATASDASGAVVSCSFTVQRPFFTINGFYPPLTSATGSCTAPAVTNNAGSRVVVKFDLLFCNSPYLSATPIPTLTIRKVVPQTGNPCAFSGNPITGPFIQGVASQWHFNWNTVKNDAGVFRIDVNLQDGNPNPPFIWVRMQ